MGAFRRVTPGGVGVIEMWTGGAGTTPNCGSAAGAANWIALTDPGIVNITAFQVNDGGSVVREIAESKTATFDSRQREIQLTLQGQLIIEEARGSTMVFREVGDVIYVRNDYVLPTI